MEDTNIIDRIVQTNNTDRIVQNSFEAFKDDIVKGKISAVRLNDYSEYEENTCSDGGNYGFWTTYKKIGNKDNKWSVLYRTTADFEYCSICGSFGHGEDKCPMEEEFATDDELINNVVRFITEHQGDDNYWVEVKMTEPGSEYKSLNINLNSEDNLIESQELVELEAEVKAVKF